MADIPPPVQRPRLCLIPLQLVFALLLAGAQGVIHWFWRFLFSTCQSWWEALLAVALLGVSFCAGVVGMGGLFALSHPSSTYRIPAWANILLGLVLTAANAALAWLIHPPFPSSGFRYYLGDGMSLAGIGCIMLGTWALFRTRKAKAAQRSAEVGPSAPA